MMRALDRSPCYRPAGGNLISPKVLVTVQCKETETAKRHCRGINAALPQRGGTWTTMQVVAGVLARGPIRRI
jgi:hypothetical protein